MLSVDAGLEAIRAGFGANGDGCAAAGAHDVPDPGMATALIPGLVDGIPAYTVKVSAKLRTPDPLSAASSACTSSHRRVARLRDRHRHSQGHWQPGEGRCKRRVIIMAE
ncbi:hypothetical protein GCM10009743_65520 [Kribbella swartbergensis]